MPKLPTAFSAVFLCLLSGCAAYDAMAPKVADKGMKANDRALATAEWTICSAVSVGSVRRRYGKSTERANSWNRLCAADKGQVVRGPAE